MQKITWCLDVLHQVPMHKLIKNILFDDQTNGFGRQIWNSYIDDCTVVMSYLSDDGEEGYPGSVLITLRFRLTLDNRLEICMRANTSRPTVVNLSQGLYFNLAGHVSNFSKLINCQIIPLQFTNIFMSIKFYNAHN